MRHLYGREELYQLLFTYALVLILGDAAKFAVGHAAALGVAAADPRRRHRGVRRHAAGLQPVHHADRAAIAVAGWLVLTRSGAGRMVRAAALDREMLGALGANVGALYTGMFVVSSFLAGLSGALVTPIQSIVPGMDVEIIVEAFIVVVIGGLGSFWGTFLGSVIYGQVLSLRHPDLPRLLAVLGVRADGGDPDPAALGPVRAAAPMKNAIAVATLAGRIPWTLIVFLAALTLPVVGSRYDTFLATQIAICALFAMSLNLLLGTTGLVSFGHAAYFGIGSYVCGILMKTYAVPFSLALPGGGAWRCGLRAWCSASSACA